MVDGIVHGGIDYAEFERLGIRPGSVIDFSVNSNPYGPSPAVRAALQGIDIAHYPDRHCLALRRAIRAHELDDTYGALDTILCGNGAAELIWAIARALLQPGDKAAIIGPTFGEYAAASIAARATVTEYRAPQGASGYVPDYAEVVAWLRDQRPALVWLCNPNNPTGHWLNRDELRQIAEACRQIGARLVVDEAYWRFLIPPEPFSAVQLIGADMPEIIVLRSLTKDFALAGLRLGYLVATVEMNRRIAAQLPSWNVSTAAQAAGVAAIEDRAHLARVARHACDRTGAHFSPPSKRPASLPCRHGHISALSMWATPAALVSSCWRMVSWCATAPRSACRARSASPPSRKAIGGGSSTHWKRRRSHDTARAHADGARDGLDGRQEHAGHRPLPHLRAGGAAGRPLQGAEYGAQLLRDARRPGDGPRAGRAGGGGRHRAARGDEPRAPQAGGGHRAAR